MKEVNTRTIWNFELRTQEGMKVLLWIFVGFQQRDRQMSQNLNKSSFFKPTGTRSQGLIGTEKQLDAAILLIYDEDKSSQGYGQFKEVFRVLMKNDILKT